MKKQCTFDTLIERADGWQRRQCTRCKYVTVSIPDLGQSINRDCDRQIGLGDWIGWLLSGVGITQPRMVAVFGSCGGCPERQAVLNQVGWQLSDRLRWLFATLKKLSPRQSQQTSSGTTAFPESR